MDKESSAAPVHWLALLVVAIVVITVFIVAAGSAPPGAQINVEFFFRLFYNCIHGACYATIGFAELSAWLAHLWIWVVVLGYILSIIALVVAVYALIRIFQLREEEEHEYGKLLLAPAAAERNQRWLHIESLIASTSQAERRQAIIEADIMLDDMLTKQGYTGAGVGEKLKSVERADFATINDAWEAHKVRNQIAHEGSAFDLSETLARRTIGRYEAVFREFGAL